MNIKKIITIGLSLLTIQSLCLSNIKSYALPSVDNEHEYGFIERTSFGFSYNDKFSDFSHKQTIFTSDGGYLILSSTKSTKIEYVTPNLYEYGVLMKYNSNGILEWSTSIGGDEFDKMTEIKEVSDGYVLIYDSDSSDINGVTYKGYDDAIIVKYNKQGQQQWINSFGGNDYDKLKKIFEVEDGYLCFGESASTNIPNYSNNGNYDNIIVKYDKQGKQQWVKSWGGNGWDSIEKVLKVKSGYIVFGYVSSTNIDGITNKGIRDILVCKYDDNFNLQTFKSFGGNNYDNISDATITSDNGYVIVGTSNSTDMEGIINKGGYDAFALKINENLEKEWIKSYSGNDYDILNKIQQTSDNGFLVSGYTTSLLFENIQTNGTCKIYMKLNYNGDIEFIKYSDSTYRIEDMIPVNDYYMAVGYIKNNELESQTNGTEDALIIGFDGSGNKFFEEKFIGNNVEYYTSIKNINNNNYFITGKSKSTNLPNINNTFGNYALFKVVSEEQIVKRLQTSQSLDLQVVADNSLEMSLSTNQISFKGYNGVADLTNNDLNITVTSCLYYDLFATLNDELRGSNDTDAIINKANLGMKTLEDSDYKNFVNIGTPLKLVDNHVNGRNINHNINLKLKGDSSVKADTYSTTITFETIQK